MRFLALILIILFGCAGNIFSQAQPQGEYHRTLIRKVEMERRKAKTKELFGVGVIMFSYKDIPREGKTKDVEPILTNTFKATDKFIGRIYLPRNVGRMDQNFPDAIIFKAYVDGSDPIVTEIPRNQMPDIEWSSWMIDFPEAFKETMAAAGSGNHTVRIELWSGYLITEEEHAAMIKAEDEKAKKAEVAATPSVTNKPGPKKATPKIIGTGPRGKMWAVGEFKVVN